MIFSFWFYLLELSIVISLSHGVPQRDLSIAKKTNLFSFDTWGLQVWIVGATYLEDFKHGCVQHTFRFPSAVILSLLQLPQNCSDIDVMKPTWVLVNDPRCQLIQNMQGLNLADEPGYFPPLRRVIWGILNSLERWKCLPDDLQHFLGVRIHSDKQTRKRELYHLIRDHFIRVPLVPVERHILNEAHINVAEK